MPDKPATRTVLVTHSVQLDMEWTRSIDEQRDNISGHGTHMIGIAIEHVGVGDVPVQRANALILRNHPVGEWNRNTAFEGGQLH